MEADINVDDDEATADMESLTIRLEEQQQKQATDFLSNSHSFQVQVSGGSRLRPGGSGPPNLAQTPKFLFGSIVILLSRCCLPNDEGPGPQFFYLELPLIQVIHRLTQEE